MTLRERWNRADWLILLGLVALTLVVWSRVLFSSHWSFGVEVDFLRQFYPARFFAARSLAAGTFPLWNPYMLSGHPFFASYQTAMLYPFNLLMVGLYGAAGADFSLKAQCGFVVFHFYLTGLFTYILARELKIGRAGSTVAAITYMFSGYLVAHAGHINQQSAAAWIPLVFFLFYRSLNRRRLSYAVATGACLGIALLAGHLQPIFYLCLLLLLFVIYTAISRWRGDPQQPGLLFGLGALGIAVLVGGALASVQLIPTFELTRLSTRRDIPYGIAAAYNLPRRQLITLLFPHFYGSSPGSYVGSWVMWETYGYCGMVGAALGVVALLRKRKGLAIFLLVVLVLSLLLALGPAGYLWTALFKSGLLFDSFRDPARTLVIFGFASALLAGFGADHLQKVLADPIQRTRYWSAVRLVAVLLALVVLLVIAVSLFMTLKGTGHGNRAGVAIRSTVLPASLLAVLLIFLILAPRVSRGTALLGVAIVALVAVDLVALNVPWTMVKVNPNDVYADAAASRYLAGQSGYFRVETDADTMYRSLDNGSLYGLEKASGDDSLVLSDYNSYRNLVMPSFAPGVQLGLFQDKGLRSHLLDLMNDVYFMSRKKIDPALSRGKFRYLGKKGGVHIYENLAAMPRVWMSDAVVVRDNEQAFEALKNADARALRKKALVVDPSDQAEEGQVIEAVKGKTVVLTHSPNHVVIETAPSSRGLLATAEVDYPGWEVFVDGRRGRILKTNFLFRGVMLPGGQRKVEFRFRSKTLCAGTVVSLVTVGLLAIYLLVLIWRRRLARSIEAGGR